MPNDDLTGFLPRAVFIWENPRARVAEYRCGLAELYPVFLVVGSVFARVPSENQGHPVTLENIEEGAHRLRQSKRMNLKEYERNDYENPVLN